MLEARPRETNPKCRLPTYRSEPYVTPWGKCSWLRALVRPGYARYLPISAATFPFAINSLTQNLAAFNSNNHSLWKSEYARLYRLAVQRNGEHSARCRVELQGRSSAAWPGWNWRITWDAEGRLTQVGTNNGLSAAFTYHALRQRVGKVRQNPFGEFRVRV